MEEPRSLVLLGSGGGGAPSGGCSGRSEIFALQPPSRRGTCLQTVRAVPGDAELRRHAALTWARSKDASPLRPRRQQP